MPAVLIRHQVRDMTIWDQVFDGDRETRRAYGAQGCCVYRNAVDSTEIMVLLQWDDPDRAWLYAQSVDLHDLLARAEAIGPPRIWILDDDGGSSGPVSR